MGTGDLKSRVASGEAEPSAIVNLLGGAALLGTEGEDQFALHDIVVLGLPLGALAHFLERCPLLAADHSLTRILGLLPSASWLEMSGVEWIYVSESR
ncbi:hypothetical protein [Pelagibius sp. 7325]|uniref:hypothetical protein n=1 Tax=Pelagibius sp. 7325 TaxID=3131994 RepID=UPI0030ED37D8